MGISKNAPFPLQWRGIKGEAKQIIWVFRDALILNTSILIKVVGDVACFLCCSFPFQHCKSKFQCFFYPCKIGVDR